MNDYKEILKRCKKQGIDTEGCHIYLEPHNFDGEYCPKGTLSHDGFWMCIPTKEYSPDFDEDIYIPVCYEIKDSFTTYLGNDIHYLVKFYLLYERK